MPDCEVLSGCIFFNDQMANMPSTSTVFKMMYCTDNFEACARFTVRREAGKEAVPEDLFPNQIDRARQILGKG
ncbi:hypothetical protein KOM00_17580 [Geomonas sp. Red69]|uniref:hypothetical protein n=1 Tax=Geomonas diazotrophica TaxID=2843197 RepID=UPI001C10D151|nr:MULTISPECIES: hypothetical protein [Geomonas]MBU5638542.1 hypothetical protein [Geomonas diazotrophica]QXE86356.1 hypothetical protein KP003_18670 [Geomonas nitrogeniifigens]